ncbi:MAG TPA: sulfite oxidase-like oxidoreductase [Anaerolineales bacterium]|nr:sulfite oxidase-like oxidoreductase [Anaerolineales bacterium]
MSEPFVSRGFVGKRRGGTEKANRIPPGQYLTEDFPVLSAGPTPRLDLKRWTFRIEGLVKEKVSWTWDELLKLPSQTFVVDISCVTKWTHLDMQWEGVSVDTLLEHIELDSKAAFMSAFSHEGYTTNMPIADILNGQAFVAYKYDGQPLAPEHGGPARLVVPHLYFWKSAKWVAGLHFMEKDQRGFWESAGYHNHGDPWKEERYSSW